MARLLREDHPMTVVIGGLDLRAVIQVVAVMM